MQNNLLSPRLLCIAGFVKNCSKIADIGTDHAYIPIYLIKNNISSFAIASDVRKGPLEKAYENVKKYNLENKIALRLGDGLSQISQNEVDTIIIAGMGGELICNILSKSIELIKKVDNIILQPMTAVKEVREFLHKNSFEIYNEKLISEGEKLYNIIGCKYGTNKEIDEKYYYLGKKLLDNKDELVKIFLENEINKLEKIVLNIKANSKSDDLISEKRKLLLIYKNFYKECKKW